VSYRCFNVSQYLFRSGGQLACTLFRFHRVLSEILATDLQCKRKHNLRGTRCISPQRQVIFFTPIHVRITRMKRNPFGKLFVAHLIKIPYLPPSKAEEKKGQNYKHASIQSPHRVHREGFTYLKNNSNVSKIENYEALYCVNFSVS